MLCEHMQGSLPVEYDKEKLMLIMKYCISNSKYIMIMKFKLKCSSSNLHIYGDCHFDVHVKANENSVIFERTN